MKSTPITLLTGAAALLLLASSSHAATDAPTCKYTDSDPDGDGWGWESHRSCQVDNSSVAAPLVVESTSAVSDRHPVCSSSAADANNDGWGWESNRSCIVAETTVVTPQSTLASSTTRKPEPEAEPTELEAEPETTEPEAEPETTEPEAEPETTEPEAEPETTEPEAEPGATEPEPEKNSRHPVCQTTAADPEGDGWGWENFRTCRVTVATQAVTETVRATQAADNSTNNRHPNCSSALVDSDRDGWGFENGRSCIVSADTLPLAPVTPPEGNTNNQKVGEIYRQNFSSAALGLYQADQLNSDWESPFWHLGFDQGRVKIVSGNQGRGKAMEVTYPAGRYGAGGASAFLTDVQFGMGLPKSYDELYVSYEVNFGKNFQFVKGGKLPGLCGYNINEVPGAGCNTGGGFPSGYDGWSARGMWRENGILENYVYHANQTNYYGDDYYWDATVKANTWHEIQHRVVLNDVGQKNGILEAWLDGTKVLSLNNLEYRKTEAIGINLFYFSTFFGGNDASWAPTVDQTIKFDNFVLSTDPIN